MHARRPWRGPEIAADVVIVGGGLGGCAAALAALRNGRTVVLTEPTDWIGGQLTSQAVPPDEHPWIEQFGANASYRALRQGIRDYYRRHYPLTAEARAIRHFNPGNGSVSRLCHEPRVALAVLTAMLAPYCFERAAAGAARARADPGRVQGDRVRAVTVRDRKTGQRTVAGRPLFPRRDRAGRPAAAGRRRVRDRRRGAGPDRRAARPAAIPSPTTSRRSPAASRSITSTARTTRSTDPPSTTSGETTSPRVKPPWPGRLLDLTYADPITLKPASRGFDPRGAGGGLVGLPANRRPPEFPARQLSRQLGDHPGQLAAERLLARPTGRRPGHGRPTPSGTSRGPSSSASRSSTGSRPNAPGRTARPAGRDCGSGPTWSGPRTAWPRPPTSANRGGSRPSSPCSSSTWAPRPGESS